MIKKTIQYQTPTGENLVEDFYFHVSKAELMDLNVRGNKGIEQIGKELAEARDGEQAWYLLKELLLMTYGERTLDGKGFTKVDPTTGIPLSRGFEAKEAFSELIIELMSDPQNAIQFFNALVPQGLKDEIEKANLAKGEQPSAAVEEYRPPVAPVPEPSFDSERTIDDYTREELLEMSNEDFEKLAGTDVSKWSHATLQVAFQRKNRQG